MPNLDDLKTTLIRSPDSTPILIRVNTGNDEITYTLQAVELRAAIIPESDSRRSLMLGQPNNTLWIVHPSGLNAPEIAVSSAELAHSLPVAPGEPTLPPPETKPEKVSMIVNTDVLNVRNVPTTVNNAPVGSLKRGDQVVVFKDDNAWKTIAEGVYAGKFVSGSLLKNA